ncbi:type II toxin-antitoxin system HicB family antitoxin [Veillonella agrestimuris]|uniref:type II toxin-antitoxin system HicB family antitoxin n=1 Tax=Veillonella agrestimuris TaxID=2941340 RepID=UPI00203B6A6F|nr:type II toxin-antitoxin system HicB family antitoxin [Veillonella agrestimuris]
MVYIYPAIVHYEDDGYWLEFPDLPDTYTQGDTIEEVMTNAVESMELTLLHLLETGEQIPQPSNIQALTTDTDSFTTLVQSNIDLAKHCTSVKKTLTIPQWLNDRALSEHLNFSQILQEALIKKLTM